MRYSAHGLSMGPVGWLLAAPFLLAFWGAVAVVAVVAGAAWLLAGLLERLLAERG